MAERPPSSPPSPGGQPDESGLGGLNTNPEGQPQAENLDLNLGPRPEPPPAEDLRLSEADLERPAEAPPEGAQEEAEAPKTEKPGRFSFKKKVDELVAPLVNSWRERKKTVEPPPEEPPKEPKEKPEKKSKKEKREETLADFESPTYEAEKKKRDPVNQYIKETLGLDPDEVKFEYIVAVDTEGEGEKARVVTKTVSNYHDFLRERAAMPDAKKRELDDAYWGGNGWNRVDFSMRGGVWKRLDDPNDPLHKHEREFRELLYDWVKSGQYPDEYATAIQDPERQASMRARAEEEMGKGWWDRLGERRGKRGEEKAKARTERTKKKEAEREEREKKKAEKEIGEKRELSPEETALQEAREVYVKAHAAARTSKSRGLLGVEVGPEEQWGKYQSVKAAFAQALYTKKKDEIKARIGKPVEQWTEEEQKQAFQEINEYRATELFQKLIIDEQDLLAKARVESLPPKEQGIVKRAMNGWMRQGKWTKLAISTALVTGAVAATGGFGAVGATGVALFAGQRFARGALAVEIGQLAGWGVDRGLARLMKTGAKKEAALSELKKEFAVDKTEYLDEAALEKISDAYQKILEEAAGPERRRLLVKTAVAIAAGAGAGVGLRMLENAYGGFFTTTEMPTPPARPTMPQPEGLRAVSPPTEQELEALNRLGAEAASPEAPPGTPPGEVPPSPPEGPPAPPEAAPPEAPPEGPPRPSEVPPTEGVERGAAAAPPQVEAPPPAVSSERLAELATIKKGEGVWHAVRRQLEEQLKADPQKFGLSEGDLQDAAKVKAALNQATGKLLIEQGYIKPDGTEIRISEPGTKVILGEDGKINVEGGKTYEWKPAAPAPEATPEGPPAPTAPEAPAPAEPEVPAAARPSSAPGPIPAEEVAGRPTGALAEAPPRTGAVEQATKGEAPQEVVRAIRAELAGKSFVDQVREVEETLQKIKDSPDQPALQEYVRILKQEQLGLTLSPNSEFAQQALLDQERMIGGVAGAAARHSDETYFGTLLRELREHPAHKLAVENYNRTWQSAGLTETEYGRVSGAKIGEFMKEYGPKTRVLERLPEGKGLTLEEIAHRRALAKIVSEMDPDGRLVRARSGKFPVADFLKGFKIEYTNK